MKYKGDELYWIAICDDEENSARLIQRILMEGETEPGKFKISIFSSGKDLMNGNVSRYDLLILDMMFPGENGRNIAEEYVKKNKSGLFVFCTDKATPLPEDFVNHPYRYLKKDRERQLRRYLLDSVEEMYRRRSKPRLQLTEGKTTVLINVEDILYMEIAKSGSNIYYFNEEGELRIRHVREKVKELYPQIFIYGFEFSHNSFLINCNYLKRWNSQELEFVNGMHMSVSRAREKKFRAACMKYIN